jgi:hypothetical protein
MTSWVDTEEMPRAKRQIQNLLFLIVFSPELISKTRLGLHGPAKGRGCGSGWSRFLDRLFIQGTKSGSNGVMRKKPNTPILQYSNTPGEVSSRGSEPKSTFLRGVLFTKCGPKRLQGL